MIYFSHKYRLENPAVWVYVSPSQFSTVNDNIKEIYKILTKTLTRRALTYYSESLAAMVRPKLHKINRSRDITQ
jgi:hypothetical protein